MSLRVMASSVSAILGLNRSKSSYEVMMELRRQKNGDTKIFGHSMLDYDTYWVAVGLIRDNYSQTTEQHISALKDLLNTGNSDVWYTKLYRTIQGRIGVMEHENFNEGKEKTYECELFSGVLLVGRPDLVRDDYVYELKTRREFTGPSDADRIQLHCYMKLTGKHKGILLETTRTERTETIIEWNDELWNRIEACIRAFVASV